MYRLLFILFLASVALGERKSYHGYQVIRVEVENSDQALDLGRFEESGRFDFWTDVKDTVDIMVAPKRSGFGNLLREMGFRYSVVIKDVQDMLDQQQSTPLSSDLMPFDSYHSLEDIYNYFNQLDVSNADVSVESIGSSFEGRDMRVIKICKGRCGNKPAMWIQAGSKARDWMGVAVATYMADQLIDNPDFVDLVDDIDWYILPSINPDGYAYSRNADRLWRKTRSAGQKCFGADAGRNWDFLWNMEGNNNNACSDNYRGTSAFSEVEVANVRDYILARQFDFFSDVNGYSDMIKGSSVGWAKSAAGIDHSVAVELGGGFLMPASEIVSKGKEILALHQSYAKQILAKITKE